MPIRWWRWNCTAGAGCGRSNWCITTCGTPSCRRAGGQATPSVYAVGGKQYVGIAAGGREGMGALGDDVVAYTLDGEGKEVVFQHGVAARMATLGIVALGVLAIVVALWRRRRRRARAGSRGNG